MAEDDIVQLIEDPGHKPAEQGPRWKVAVIDDEPAVHDGTRFALSDYRLNGQGLEILSAYSAAEGRELMRRHPDVAVVLLDVIMDTDTAAARRRSPADWIVAERGMRRNPGLGWGPKRPRDFLGAGGVGLLQPFHWQRCLANPPSRPATPRRGSVRPPPSRVLAPSIDPLHRDHERPRSRGRTGGTASTLQYRSHAGGDLL